MDRYTHWDEGERLMEMYDAVVEAALSLASYAHSHGIECTLAVLDDAGAVRAFSAMQQWDYLDILDVLPRLEAPKGSGVAGAAVRDLASGLYSSSNIIVCSAAPDEVLLNELVQAHMRQRNAVLLAARPADVTRQEDDQLLRKLSQLSMAQVPYVCFGHVEELQEREL